VVIEPYKYVDRQLGGGGGGGIRSGMQSFVE